MAPQNQWTENEKVQLLLSIIRQGNVAPKWDTLAVPESRTLRACQNVFRDMKNGTTSGSPGKTTKSPSKAKPTATSPIKDNKNRVIKKTPTKRKTKTPSSASSEEGGMSGVGSTTPEEDSDEDEDRESDFAASPMKVEKTDEGVEDKRETKLEQGNILFSR